MLEHEPNVRPDMAQDPSIEDDHTPLLVILALLVIGFAALPIACYFIWRLTSAFWYVN